jgi:energy-converting hydrogenase Eha subunit G
VISPVSTTMPASGAIGVTGMIGISVTAADRRRLGVVRLVEAARLVVVAALRREVLAAFLVVLAARRVCVAARFVVRFAVLVARRDAEAALRGPVPRMT